MTVESTTSPAARLRALRATTVQRINPMSAIAPRVAPGSLGRKHDVRELADELADLVQLLRDAEEFATKQLARFDTDDRPRHRESDPYRLKCGIHRMRGSLDRLRRTLDDLDAGRLVLLLKSGGRKAESGKRRG